jgi:hypothetical protein
MSNFPSCFDGLARGPLTAAGQGVGPLTARERNEAPFLGSRWTMSEKTRARLSIAPQEALLQATARRWCLRQSNIQDKRVQVLVHGTGLVTVFQDEERPDPWAQPSSKRGNVEDVGGARRETSSSTAIRAANRKDEEKSENQLGHSHSAAYWMKFEKRGSFCRIWKFMAWAILKPRRLNRCASAGYVPKLG